MKSTIELLTDLYAGGELPEETVEALNEQAKTDPILAKDLRSLTQVVQTLQSEDFEFTEETHQRILMKIYARGGHLQPQAPEPKHLQYHLPISG